MPDASSKSVDNAAGLPRFCSSAAVSSSSSPIVSFRSCLNLSVIGNNSSTIRLDQPFVKIERPYLKARQITLTFRSVPHAVRFSPVCRMLQNGSTRKVIKTLMQISTKERDQNALLVIYDFVRNEVTLAQKHSSDVFKGSEVQDLNTIELQNIVNGAKETAHVLWNILSAAIDPKEDSRLKRNHLLSTFSILLHGRSQQLNAFQYLVSHSLHENNLDKDGYAALNSLGMCVSYHSIHSKLADVRDQEQFGESREQRMENDWEQTIENNGEQAMENDAEQTMENDEEQMMENDEEQMMENDVEQTMKNDVEQTMKNDMEQTMKNDVEQTMKSDVEQTMKNDVEQTMKNEGDQNITDRTHHDGRVDVLKHFTSKLWSRVLNTIVDENKETDTEDNDNEELI